MTLQKFEQYIKNTNLADSSRNVYMKVIRELLSINNEPSIDVINSFITQKVGKRQPHAKYAIVKYLESIGRQQDIPLLRQVNIKAPLREKVFLSKEEANRLINSIKDKMHKDIALLQYNTGTRASEVLSIRKNKISRQMANGNEVIRINIIGKGSKTRPVYLLSHFWEVLEPYYNNCIDYLFLKDKHNQVTYLTFWQRVENAYKYYYASLKLAAKKCDLNLSTHDLRRSFGEDIKNETDILVAQKALGHADIRTTTKYLNVKDQEIINSMLARQENFLK